MKRLACDFLRTFIEIAPFCGVLMFAGISYMNWEFWALFAALIWNQKMVEFHKSRKGEEQ